MNNDSFMLVIGLYTYDDLLDHAARAFEGYDLFSPLADPGHKLLWESVRDVYKNTKVKPTPYMLSQQCITHLPTIDPLMRRRAEEQIVQVLMTFRDKNCESLIKREHVKVLMQAASRRAAVDKLLLSNTLEHNTTEALVEHVDSVSSMLQNISPKQGVLRNPLAKDERKRLLRVTPRWNWGIDYWDAAGLTWYKKEIHGLLGPTGGGKTVNMTNIATRQIKEGRKVLVALYEQALEEDVEQRILSNLAGVSMNELRDKEEHEISPEANAKIDRACEKYNNMLYVLDMVGKDAGTGGPAELKAMIEEAKRTTGFEPDLIIIDWLGEMVMRYEHLGSTDAAYRRCCEKFMSDLVQYKEDTGYSFLILHQTNTEAQGKGPGYVPKKTQAHEFRSFAYKCDSCSILGVMDRIEQVCWFVPDKSRRSASKDRLIKLNGEYMKFYDVTNEYTLVGNAFIGNATLAAQEAEAAARLDREDDDFA